MNKLSTGARWGQWFLNAERLLLEYRPEAEKYLDVEAGCQYYIPLRDLLTPDGVQQWVDQLSEKSWVTKKVRANFSQAINDIFYPPRSFSFAYLEERLRVVSEEEAEQRREDDLKTYQNEQRRREGY